MDSKWRDVTKIGDILDDLWKQISTEKDSKKVDALRETLYQYWNFISDHNFPAFQPYEQKYYKHREKATEIYNNLLDNEKFWNFYGPLLKGSAGIAIIGTLLFAAYKYFPVGSKKQEAFLENIKVATGVPIDQLSSKEVHQIINDVELLDKSSLTKKESKRVVSRNRKRITSNRKSSNRITTKNRKSRRTKSTKKKSTSKKRTSILIN